MGCDGSNHILPTQQSETMKKKTSIDFLIDKLSAPEIARIERAKQRAFEEIQRGKKMRRYYGPDKQSDTLIDEAEV
jgi:hypothetical protein